MSPTNPTKTFEYETGIKLMSERRFKEALSEFRGVVAAHPDHAEANFQAGRILLEAFQASEAMEWLTNAVRLKPEDPKHWQGWAEAVALGGDAEQRCDFLAALKDAPIDAKLRVQLQDRFGARSKSSRPATGGASKAAINALVAALQGGAPQKAEAMSAKLLASHPKSAIAMFVLASAQEKLGKSKEAFASYQKAVRLDPLYAEAYGATGELLVSVNQPKKALSAFRPAVILTPDSVPALVGLIQSLTHSENYRPTVQLLKRASALDPRNPTLLTGLGDVLKRVGDYPQAIANYEKALGLYAKDQVPSSLKIALADALSQAHQDDKSLALVKSVIEIEPSNPDALISFATGLQMNGEFENADAVFRKAIEVAPDNGEAFRRLVAGYKVSDGDPLIDTMAAQFDRSDLNERDRMNFGFALGKALEDAGAHDRVFKYLKEANRIAADISKASRHQLFTEIEENRRVFAPIDFANVAPATENDFAPIFVTGLPRSGTTLVERIIAAHSTVDSGGELGIAKPLCGEMRTAPPGSAKSADNIEALTRVGREYTKAIMLRFPDVARLTDKSIYTFLALGPIKCALPKSKFIVVRRDPRANLFSMYKNKFADGSHGYANDMESLARYYDEFDKTITFWRDRIPDWFYEVSYEALVEDPEPEARKLIAACGLEWEDDCLNFHKKKGKVQTLSVYQVRQPISKGSVSGWRRFEADLAPMLDQLRKDGHVTD